MPESRIEAALAAMRGRRAVLVGDLVLDTYVYGETVRVSREAPVVVVSLCSSHDEHGPRGLSFLLDRNRLNVAVSRARSLAIVVGDPGLTTTHCRTIDDMVRVNLLCRIVEQGT